MYIVWQMVQLIENRFNIKETIDILKPIIIMENQILSNIDKNLKRIADALEESNKIMKKNFIIEKKKFNRDYIVETTSNTNSTNNG